MTRTCIRRVIGLYCFWFFQHSSFISLFYVLKAIDRDAEAPNNVVRYEIINGNYNNRFTLNPETGKAHRYSYLHAHAPARTLCLSPCPPTMKYYHIINGVRRSQFTILLCVPPIYVMLSCQYNLESYYAIRFPYAYVVRRRFKSVNDGKKIVVGRA